MVFSSLPASVAAMEGGLTVTWLRCAQEDILLSLAGLFLRLIESHHLPS